MFDVCHGTSRTSNDTSNAILSRGPGALSLSAIRPPPPVVPAAALPHPAQGVGASARARRGFRPSAELSVAQRASVAARLDCVARRVGRVGTNGTLARTGTGGRADASPARSVPPLGTAGAGHARAARPKPPVMIGEVR